MAQDHNMAADTPHGHLSGEEKENKKIILVMVGATLSTTKEHCMFISTSMKRQESPAEGVKQICRRGITSDPRAEKVGFHF